MEFEPINYYISSLHAKDIRLFKELDIKFNSRFNFIIGANGTGKTSILRFLSLCLSTNNINDSRFGENPEVWLDLNHFDKKYRIGQGAKSILNPGQPSWVLSNGFMSANHQTNISPPTDGVDASFTLRDLQSNSLVSSLSPLFIGAYRKLDYKQINGMNREAASTEQRNIYRNNSSSSLSGSYLPDVKQWLINRYFVIEKDWAKIEKCNWQWLMTNLNKIAPKETNFVFKEIRQDLEPKFILDGNECYLEELSGGFKSILSIILAIFEWIEVTNDGGRRLVEKAQGTVIIDELDAHLHPEWQFTIRETLETVFPYLQFIITTHSPHLIATAKSGEILRLPKHDGILNVEPSNTSYAGWNTDQILEGVMEVESIKSKIYEQLVAKALKFAEENNPIEMKKIIEELKIIAHPDDTIVLVLTMKLSKLLMECSE